MFSGIKRGLALGKVVIDVSRDVIDRLRHIEPHLAHRLERITHSPSFEKLDTALKVGNALVGNHQNINGSGMPFNQVIRPLPNNDRDYRHLNEVD